MTPFERQEIIKAQILGSYNIQKSQDENDIEKGGEGSKGGKVVGHTKSGKPIYSSFSHEEHKGFTSEDHMDASNLHKKEWQSKEYNSADEAMNDSWMKMHKHLKASNSARGKERGEGK